MSVSAAGSAVLALAIGLRHGLDADHLAAIDGLTRFNSVRRRAVARYCGMLFSAGHGAAIVFAASALAAFASAWVPPIWLEPVGKLFSSAVLLLLGASNLRLAMSVPASQHVGLIGARTRILSGLLQSSRPWQVMLVGVLFALSFDALGLAAMFAASAAALGGAVLASVFAFTFALGMVIVDTGNGIWVAQLARESNHRSKASSRAMTFTVAAMSLLLGVAIACSCFSPRVDSWLSVHELGVSLIIVVGVLCAYLLQRLARRNDQKVCKSGRTPHVYKADKHGPARGLHKGDPFALARCPFACRAFRTELQPNCNCNCNETCRAAHVIATPL